ncbi:MAG: restriction endonuclease subunit S [Bacteroidota bacterium]
MTNLIPYPKYKSAKEKWLGKLPEHWNELRAKYVMRESDRRSENGKETLLSVSQYTGVTARKQKHNGSELSLTRALSLTGYKLVKKDDLVINIMLAWNGSLGISSLDGLVSPAYGVYRFGKTFHPRYYHYLLRTQLYKGKFKVESTGVVESRLRLYSDNLFRIPLLIPEYEEQQAIVKYLNWFEKEINNYIRIKKRQIELLNEQKRAIINHAVTRGINPNVKLKHSGIDWLGEIPEHWEVRRLKYLLREIDQRSIDGREILLKVSQYTGITPRQKLDGKPISRALSFIGYKKVDNDDLVINIMLAWNGSLGISKYSGIVSPAYCVYRFKNSNKILSEFYGFLLKSIKYRKRIKTASTGVIESRLRLYTDQLGRIEVLVPPINEQNDIVQYLIRETKEYDRLIINTVNELNLIREFRQQIITDAVTGAVDVRGVNVPEVKEEEIVAEVELEEGDDVETEETGN